MAKVKSHRRRTKGGQVALVKEHERKGEPSKKKPGKRKMMSNATAALIYFVTIMPRSSQHQYLKRHLYSVGLDDEDIRQATELLIKRKAMRRLKSGVLVLTKSGRAVSGFAAQQYKHGTRDWEKIGGS